MKRSDYIEQVSLLLNCLPALSNQDDFALKGGTAINFFFDDLPRLSVDIDLTYTKFFSRKEAIQQIEYGLVCMKSNILKRYRQYQIKELKTESGVLHKLLVSNYKAQIKIEPNFTLRGTLLPIEFKDICRSVEDQFEYSLRNIPVVAEAELFAGKICAALSRQHPRDLFDIKRLLERTGLTDDIRQAFVIYLVCSPRPIHELLQPNVINLRQVYEAEFASMTTHEVFLEELLDVRSQLIKTIHEKLSINEREFIFSVKKGAPDYTLMPFENLHKFPALQWKVMNIKKMVQKKHNIMLNKLIAVLQT